MKIKDLNIFNKRKGAALLAGMTLLTLPGCGKKNIEKDPQPGASVSIDEETITKEKDSTTKTGNTSTGKTTSSSTGTGTESTYVDNGTEYVEYTDSTEGYTEGQTEGKTEGQTEGQTEGKTEAKTEGKTGSTGVQLPSDHRVGNSYEDPTEAKTTHKTTTIKNSNIKVTTTTKKVTTTAKPTTTKKVTTTTKVVTTQPTTQKPTEPPTTQPPVVHNETLENIAHDAYIFEKFAQHLHYELYGGYAFETSYGTTGGGRESELLLAILNYGQIDESVLQEVLGSYSADEMADYGNFGYNIAQMKRDHGVNVDFTKYTLNRTIGEYINSLSAAADNGNLADMIRNAWENDDMPDDCLNHPAPYIALASYDEYYDNSQVLTGTEANVYIVCDKVDEIISKVVGRSYTRN